MNIYKRQWYLLLKWDYPVIRFYLIKVQHRELEVGDKKWIYNNNMYVQSKKFDTGAACDPRNIYKVWRLPSNIMDPVSERGSLRPSEVPVGFTLLIMHINSEGIGYCPSSLLTQSEGNVSTIQDFLIIKKDLVLKFHSVCFCIIFQKILFKMD